MIENFIVFDVLITTFQIDRKFILRIQILKFLVRSRKVPTILFIVTLSYKILSEKWFYGSVVNRPSLISPKSPASFTFCKEQIFRYAVIELLTHQCKSHLHI